MSGLAKLLSQMGHSLTASDLKMSPTLAGLADLGIEVWAGSRPEAMSGLNLVVASSAIPDVDPEVVAARQNGIEIWERPRLLSELTAHLPTVGATGTHGKTTSTAMLVAALRATGLDPSFVVGGELTDLRTNASLGEDDLLVLEVDEAFGTFLDLSIKGLMVTNVEPDHLDYYHISIASKTPLSRSYAPSKGRWWSGSTIRVGGGWRNAPGDQPTAPTKMPTG